MKAMRKKNADVHLVGDASQDTDNISEKANRLLFIWVVSKPVVVNLFCIGTPFRICSKTCTPLPCTTVKSTTAKVQNLRDFFAVDLA